MGLPIGEAARTAMVAVNLARGAGCTESDVSDVYYAGLLQHIGCTAYAHEVTELFADEFSIKRAGLATDFTRRGEIVGSYLPRITRESPAGERIRTLRSALLHSRRMTEGYMLANCETASIIAKRIGLPTGVCSGLLDIFEWFNRDGGLPSVTTTRSTPLDHSTGRPPTDPCTFPIYSSPALNFSIAINGLTRLRTWPVAKALRITPLPSTFPIEPMTIAWSSDR